MLLSAEHISKSYGTRTILDDVSLYLEPGQKLGVIGINGTGKSTLLRILAGAEEPDGGSVSRDPNVRLDYLPQQPDFDPASTVLEQTIAGLSPEARELAEHEAKAILTRLGVPMFDQPVGSLSGGQRKRVALASALVSGCDVLILDEPTNHLDSEMVGWLEDHLRAFKGALVMVTHDRYFLERVTDRLVELERGRLYFYEGNYDEYLERKTQREEMTQASERKRQAILRRELQWIMQGPTARGTKSRERIERYEALKAQAGPAETARMEISALSSRLGKKTIELQGVGKSFDGRTVLEGFDLMLLRDDRIGIVGRNGSGKSTLLNLIAGRLPPDGGKVEVGETVRSDIFLRKTRLWTPISGSSTTSRRSATPSRLRRAALPPPSCWSSSSSRRRSRRRPSASSLEGKNGASSSSGYWLRHPRDCGWTSLPMTWTSRRWPSWKTILKPFQVQ